MKSTALTLAVTLAAGIALGVFTDRLVSAQQTSPKRTPLLRVDLADMEGKEANMWMTEIAPGATTDKHYHLGHLFVYVLEGSVMHTVEQPGKAPVTYSAGQAWHESPKEVHWGKNASTAQPVRLLAVRIGEKGQPLATPVK